MSFFRKAVACRRHAALYIHRSGRSAIVVPMHYNGVGGLLMEDEAPTVLDPVDSATLTPAVKEAVLRSSIRVEVNLRDRKKTDWPAFRASGVSSVRKFEVEFIRLSVSGANDSNVTYVIEGWAEPDAELSVCASVAAESPELGERCLVVFRACRDRTI